jgi:hypothetical protein
VSLTDYFKHNCHLPDGQAPGETYRCGFCRATWTRLESPKAWFSENAEEFEIIGVMVRYKDGTVGAWPA